jgi:DNA repair protein SbcD/Mre11
VSKKSPVHPTVSRVETSKNLAGKFAHISDCHLGAWMRDQKLRDLNTQAFRECIKRCIKEKVDFIIITGDFFDRPTPDLETVREAAEILRETKEAGIRVYMIYGSHDFVAQSTSILDILQSAGLFVKVMRVRENESPDDDRIRLEFFTDTETKVKLAGLSGRIKGLDVKYYENLDRESLEKEDGFKIFLFHAPICEVRSKEFSFGDCVPESLLPKGFKYYAGGHLHERIPKKVELVSKIFYPGPTFGPEYTDLEASANGEERGFYITEFNDFAVLSVKFVPIKVAEIVSKFVDAENKTADQLDAKLKNIASEIDGKGKVVLINPVGKLSQGKKSNIAWGEVRAKILARGALTCYIKSAGVIQPEEQGLLKLQGKSPEEVEQVVFKERIARFQIDPSIKDEKVISILKSKLVTPEGEKTAKQLLEILKNEPVENEKKSVFEERIELQSNKEVFNYEQSRSAN